ncbi:MAG: SDR family oxidoreductase [Bacteroidetes Order II. Incertae sedis bacterium]|nr:SDR family oxidoreductase [Bacteroidetes Order II. bacterium]
MRNVANGLLLFFGSTFLSSSFTFAYHEYGHGTRAAAVGFRPFYGHGAIETDADLQAALSGSVKTNDNFLSFYASSLFNIGGFTLAVPEKTRFAPLTDELNDGWDSLLQTGGLNNEMLFTEFVEDELHRQGGHIGFLIPFLSGKLAAQNYATGSGVFNDVTNIANYYQSRGFKIDNDDIGSGSKVSIFASALSYQFVYQFLRIFSGKTARFHPWKVRGLYLPNTLFYMNRSGLSYKIRSGYRSGEWRFPFAIEYVFEGEKRTEFTVGAEKEFEKITAGFEATVGRHFEFAFDASYRHNERFIISGGYALYDQRNLHGERLRELGGLDILVNNAGGTSDLYAVQPEDAEGFLPTWQINEDIWDAFLNGNLKSVFLCTQAAFRHMADNEGGEIINIASQMGHGRATIGGAYAVAKRGVIALTEIFDYEGKNLGIRVNAVSPGLVTTPGQTRFMKEILGIAEDKQPPKQPAENVAKAVVYLLCDAPAEMRGQSIRQF